MTSPIPQVRPDQPDVDVLDVAWLAAPRRRSRLRSALVVVLAVLLVFLGGVEVQKRWGTSSGSAVAGPSARSFPAGGFSGFPTGSTTGSTTGATTGATAPAVIGRLTGIHGHTWTVQDLGGTSHRVLVTSATTVTRSLGRATGPIRPGSSVTVQGTTHGHTVTATAVTIR